MSKPDYVHQTFIACSRDALWEALTDPKTMEAYHFATSHVTKESDTYVWHDKEGKAFLRQKTLEITPKSRIEATFEPDMGGEKVPASRTVMLLSEEGDYCALTIEHYDTHFPLVHGEGIADGWPRWAASLKTYLEQGDTPRFSRAPD